MWSGTPITPPLILSWIGRLGAKVWFSDNWGFKLSQVMKKEKSPLPLNSVGNQDGRVIYDYQVSHLEGRLLTLIDGLGLRESQETAVKDMLKGILRTALFVESYYVYGDLLQPVVNNSIQRQHSGAGVQNGS